MIELTAVRGFTPIRCQGFRHSALSRLTALPDGEVITVSSQYGLLPADR